MSEQRQAIFPAEWLSPSPWAAVQETREERLYRRIAELEKALNAIADGDVPRPVSFHYRKDWQPSKNDRCIHEMFMYEDCGLCIEEFARAELAKGKP
jgi:hypothetical protein